MFPTILKVAAVIFALVATFFENYSNGTNFRTGFSINFGWGAVLCLSIYLLITTS